MSKQTFDDIKVGDTVWIEVNSPSYRKQEVHGLEEGTVTKVGREYFYIKSGRWNEMKFRKDTGRQFVGPNDNGHYASLAWRHKEEYENHVADEKDRSKLESLFRQYGVLKSLTREQVTAILRIMDPDEA